MVIENRNYNLTADALNQAISLSEIYMPGRVTSVDVMLEENGMVGPTINYVYSVTGEARGRSRPTEQYLMTLLQS